MKSDSPRVNQTSYVTRVSVPVDVEDPPSLTTLVVPAEVPATSPPGAAVGTGPADSAPRPTPQLAATMPRRAATMTASAPITTFMASP
jgi:hypothetical protein